MEADATQNFGWENDLGGSTEIRDASVCGHVADGGFNNRRQALQIALALAVATNRTLVLSSFTLGHNAGPEVPASAFFHVDCMAEDGFDFDSLPHGFPTLRRTAGLGLLSPPFTPAESPVDSENEDEG